MMTRPHACDIHEWVGTDARNRHDDRLVCSLTTHKQAERERQRDREKEREGKREKERENKRKKEREKEREKGRERERE